MYGITFVNSPISSSGWAVLLLINALAIILRLGSGDSNLSASRQEWAAWVRFVRFGSDTDEGSTAPHVGLWRCVPEARIASGGGIRSESCRLIW
jgi:hypothetical protein